MATPHNEGICESIMDDVVASIPCEKNNEKTLNNGGLTGKALLHQKLHLGERPTKAVKRPKSGVIEENKTRKPRKQTTPGITALQEIK